MINPYHKKYLKTVQDFKIFLVDGQRLRRVHIEFVEGTNFMVKKYVPAGEIWIDDNLKAKPKDMAGVILHEVFEVGQMKKGLSYEKAHRAANRKEKSWRLKNTAK